MPEFIVYVQNQKKEYTCILSDNPDEVVKLTKLPAMAKYHQFPMLGKKIAENAVEQELKKYYKEFVKCCKQLKCNDIFDFDYLAYYQHSSAIVKLFEILVQGEQKPEPVDLIESEWIQKCNNSDLLYCKEGRYEQCYSYDYNFHYGRCLADRKMIIPIRTGTEVRLKKVPELTKSIQAGFYNVRIICDDEEFRKIFSFSKEHIYNHYSVRFANDRKKKYNITMEMVQNDDDADFKNAYTYKPKDCVVGNDVFWLWFKKLSELKKTYPKNFLIKHLCSSLWGSLSKFYTICRTEKEIEEQNLDLGDDYSIVEEKCDKYGNILHYILVKNNRLFASNWARIKPFLKAFSRNKTALLAEKDIKSVVRICTDSVTFTREFPTLTTEDDSIKLEQKYTGTMIWKSVKKGVKVIT